MESKATGVIYVMRDPRTNDIRYVGQSKDLKTRIRFHKLGSKYLCGNNPEKHRWQAELAAQGLEPVFEVYVDHVLIDFLDEAERGIIQELIDEGCDLLNKPAGIIRKSDFVSESKREEWQENLQDVIERLNQLHSEVSRIYQKNGKSIRRLEVALKNLKLLKWMLE